MTTDISPYHVIRGPGLYRRRDGGAAEVVYRRGSRWYGHFLMGNAEPFLAMSWRANGAARTVGCGDSPHDLLCLIGCEPQLGMAGGEFAEPLFEREGQR